MGLFKIEQSKAAYRADFVLYSTAVLLLTAFLLLAGPHQRWMEMILVSFVGLSGWTALEYVLHRFVLHGLQPFHRWHMEHHQRPRALICTSTILSATLIALLVFLPALLLGDLWRACALTLGLLTGYLAYAITHHAIHHWRAENAWLKRRKRWHALHHYQTHEKIHDQNVLPSCYGVTTAFWDHVFGSTRRTAGQLAKSEIVC